MIVLDNKHFRQDLQRLLRYIIPIVFTAIGFYFVWLHEQKLIQSDNNCITISTGAVVYLNPIITVEPVMLPSVQPKTWV